MITKVRKDMFNYFKSASSNDVDFREIMSRLSQIHYSDYLLESICQHVSSAGSQGEDDDFR